MLFRFLLCIGLLVSSAFAKADYPRTLNFINALDKKKIAVGEVQAILQDEKGFMWFGGSAALLRYDGYDFIPAYIQVSESESIPVSQVVSLFEDSDNVLWAGTHSGLIRFDRDQNVFRTLRPSTGPQLDIFKATVEKILQAPTGELLVGAYSGLHVIDRNTLISTPLIHDPSDPTSIPNNVIRDMIFEDANTLWLATEAGLVRCDWRAKTFKGYIPYPEKPDSLPHNSGWSLQVGPQGNIWLGVPKGLYKFNPSTETFKRYHAEGAEQHGFSGELIYEMILDDQNRLWIATDTRSLNLYVPEEDRFIEYLSDGGIGSLVSNSIRTVYQDKNKDIWVGHYPSGISFHARSSAAFEKLGLRQGATQTLISDHVGAVVESVHGDVWVGAGGATKIEKSTGEFVHYYSGEEPSARIASGSIISGLADSSGGIWFGTWAGGMYRYSPEQDRFLAIPFDDSLAKKGLKSAKVLNDDVVWAIFEDSNKDIWVGTHNGGLSRYDRSNEIFYFFEQDPNDTENSISNELVWDIFEDSKKRFWVATASGVDLMDRKTGIFKHYNAYNLPPSGLPGGSVYSVFEDSKNRVWFGTDTGLYQYIEESDTFKGYGIHEGFSGKTIRSITEDRFGRLWMGTENGVVAYDPQSKLVNNYQEVNGETLSTFNSGAIVHTADGKVFVGGPEGLYSFDTEKLEGNSYIPPVVITDFKLFTKSVPIGGSENILSRSIESTQSIVLDYKKTMLSFDFAALSYRNPEKNQYAYMLEGFDEEWRYVGNQRTALYTNLDAGKYVFRVKASNNDGVWNEEGVSVGLKQLPPPWQTWWAYSLYAMTLVLVVLQLINVQRKKRRLVEEQNRLLEHRVAERTAELREKNCDIQAMLSNMRQGLFAIEANGCIHQEYSEHLESIYETQSLAGQDVFEVMFSDCNLGLDRLNQIREAIGAVIGEDELVYSFNSHLLPGEYTATIKGTQKCLALDWNPILLDDQVHKLMVSVRDVTQLKQVEQEAQAKQRELDIISQLLNLPSKKFLKFLETCKRLLGENSVIIRNVKNDSEASVASLFRNMHTVKGNCRTFAFNYISEAAHRAESHYAGLKSRAYESWDVKALEAELNEVRDVLSEYEGVYKNVLGREGKRSENQQQLGFWANEQLIDGIRNYVRIVEQRFPAILKMDDVNPINHLIDHALSTPLSEVLEETIASVPSMARGLGKESPNIILHDNGVRICNTSEELINNIFAHILRNAIDHGIEAPDLRLGKGKPEAGTISILAAANAGQLELQVEDDGQGLNLQAIYQLGLQRGYWNSDQDIGLNEMADLVFKSGLSTKSAVTDISGRGVGMDAVKQFIVDAGGLVEIQFPPDASKVFQKDMHYQSFKLVIRLPSEHYFCDVNKYALDSASDAC